MQVGVLALASAFHAALPSAVVGYTEMLSSAAKVLSGLVYSGPLTLVGLIAAMADGTEAQEARLLDHGEVRLLESFPDEVQPDGKSPDCSSA